MAMVDSYGPSVHDRMDANTLLMREWRQIDAISSSAVARRAASTLRGSSGDGGTQLDWIEQITHGIVEADPDSQYAAALHCAYYGTSADERADLMSMLGLDLEAVAEVHWNRS